jgi:hypothetical protein
MSPAELRPPIHQGFQRLQPNHCQTTSHPASPLKSMHPSFLIRTRCRATLACASVQIEMLQTTHPLFSTQTCTDVDLSRCLHHVCASVISRACAP